MYIKEILVQIFIQKKKSIFQRHSIFISSYLHTLSTFFPTFLLGSGRTYVFFSLQFFCKHISIHLSFYEPSHFENVIVLFKIYIYLRLHIFYLPLFLGMDALFSFDMKLFMLPFAYFTGPEYLHLIIWQYNTFAYANNLHTINNDGILF